MKQECGHIGVNIIPFTLGFTIGPPADKEYAVEPVGVDIINPSAFIICYHIIIDSYTKM